MIRQLFKTDIEKIVIIEQAAHVVPWTADTFKTCLQAGYSGWVLEIDKHIIGFIVVAMNHEECHVLNLCVNLAQQRQGYGQQLLAHALSQAKAQGVAIAYLEVRKSNRRAINLYQKMQFQLVGERKDYYPTVSGVEDALIFARSLRP